MVEAGCALEAEMERELTTPVNLTGPDGFLNPHAVGWARTPLVTTDGIAAPRRGLPPKAWGRNKRWEYWNVMTPTHILALTVSDLDYGCVNEVWVYNRSTGEEMNEVALRIPARGVTMPGTLGAGKVRARGGGVNIAIDEVEAGTRLRAKIDDPAGVDVRFSVIAEKPEGHEALAVVVPWSSTRFQYTVKDVARPARGRLQIGSHTYRVPEGSWAVLDHGRGRWPYNITWNWGAGSGIHRDHTFGIQVGGKWTDGTGSTENAFFVDGRAHKISEDLTWEYDVEDFMAPWHIHGGGLDATFTPFHNKRSRTQAGILSGATDQCFGVWEGTFTPANDPERVYEFAGIEGFAEHVHNKW